MPKQKGPKFKINVTGMTEGQHKFIQSIADERGSNKADVVKGLITDAMKREGE